MSALTAPRNNFLNKSKFGRKIGRPAKSGFTFYNGALVVVDASGYIKPNTGVAGEKVVGCVDLKQHPSVTTSGADGATFLDVIDGILPFFIGSSGDALAQADVGNVVYASDDCTVGKTDGGTQLPICGQLVAIESIGGVTLAMVAIDVAWPESSRAGGTADAVSAAGAISPNTDITELTIAGTMAFTLGAGTRIGQRKVVVTVAASATPVGTLTSPSSHGWTTISGLGGLGKVVEFIWTAAGWDIAGGLGVTVA